MKNFKYKLLSLAALITFGIVTPSCNDDDSYFDSDAQSKKIEVTQVYLEDYKSSVPDRPVTFARLGQLIRIEGSGLYGMKKVYINGYDTYFNRAYTSDRSMLVTINTKTPISDCDPEVRNTIRLVKDKAEYTFEFLIQAATPTVTSVSNTLPLPGETVTVYGTGLQETSRILLPDGSEITEGITSDNEDGEWYSFTMPAGLTAGGSLTATTANGTAITPAYFNERRGILLDFDTDGQQGAWGKESDGTIPAGKSMVFPEDLVDDPAGTGRGKCMPLIPERLLENGIKSGLGRAVECHSVGDGNKNWEDWSRLSDLIPAETPVTEVAFQFDVYCPDPWTSGGMIQIQLVNNYNFAGFNSDDAKNKEALIYIMAPWLETWKGGALVPFQATEWRTITIPFSDFYKYANIIADAEKSTPTFQMVIDDRNAATYPNFGIGFSNRDFDYVNESGDTVEFVSSLFTGPRVYIDNWRIVPCKDFTVSDYPEDEE